MQTALTPYRLLGLAAALTCCLTVAGGCNNSKTEKPAEPPAPAATADNTGQAAPDSRPEGLPGDSATELPSATSSRKPTFGKPPPECADYVAAVEQYARCEKVPEEAGAALRLAAKNIAQAASRKGMPDAASEAGALRCKQAHSGLMRAAKGQGCTL